MYVEARVVKTLDVGFNVQLHAWVRTPLLANICFLFNFKYIKQTCKCLDGWVVKTLDSRSNVHLLAWVRILLLGNNFYLTSNTSNKRVSAWMAEALDSRSDVHLHAWVQIPLLAITFFYLMIWKHALFIPKFTQWIS